jgi:3-oxoacyl-[acyl-carrier protein] reductase
MDLGLAGRTAIVTGGGSGLGAAVCEAFCREGANVILNYIVDKTSAAALAERLSAQYGTQCLPCYGDISSAPDIDRVISHAEVMLSGIDILVNNAGTWPTARILDMSDEDWESTLRINLTGTFMFSKRMVAWLHARKRKGKITNIVSQAAFHGSTSGHAHYAAAKAGVVNFTVSLAREAAEYGINVNAVAPGIIATPLMGKALEARLAEYVARIPLGRIASPEDIADVVVFLCSNKADYMTGATVDVTGGMLMR